MRFEIKCKLDKKIISIDYRRKILSFFKKSLENYNIEIKKAIYDEPQEKGFTFSVYLPVEKILGNKIYLKNNDIKIFLSVENLMEGLHFYNAIIGSKDDKFLMGENYFILKDIIKREEKIITNDYAYFKTLSPIVIREVNEKKSEWYHDFDKDGVAVLKQNIVYNLINKFSKEKLEELEIKPIDIKRTVVSFYGIKFPVTIGKILIKGDKEILNYLYKAGFGSKSSAGFGMLEVVEERNIG